MSNRTPEPESKRTAVMSRRTVMTAAAWATPVIALSVASPAMAASDGGVPPTITISPAEADIQIGSPTGNVGFEFQVIVPEADYAGATVHITLPAGYVFVDNGASATDIMLLGGVGTIPAIKTTLSAEASGATLVASLNGVTATAKLNAVYVPVPPPITDGKWYWFKWTGANLASFMAMPTGITIGAGAYSASSEFYLASDDTVFMERGQSYNRYTLPAGVKPTSLGTAVGRDCLYVIGSNGIMYSRATEAGRTTPGTDVVSTLKYSAVASTPLSVMAGTGNSGFQTGNPDSIVAHYYGNVPEADSTNVHVYAIKADGSVAVMHTLATGFQPVTGLPTTATKLFVSLNSNESNSAGTNDSWMLILGADNNLYYVPKTHSVAGTVAYAMGTVPSASQIVDVTCSDQWAMVRTAAGEVFIINASTQAAAQGAWTKITFLPAGVTPMSVRFGSDKGSAFTSGVGNGYGENFSVLGSDGIAYLAKIGNGKMANPMPSPSGSQVLGGTGTFISAVTLLPPAGDSFTWVSTDRGYDETTYFTAKGLWMNTVSWPSASGTTPALVTNKTLRTGGPVLRGQANANTVVRRVESNGGDRANVVFAITA